MNNSSQALDRPRKKAENIGLQAAPASSQSEDGALDLNAIWETLTRHKWTILLTCILITGVDGGYTWTLPKVYEARSIVSVEEPKAAAPVEKGH